MATFEVAQAMAHPGPGGSDDDLLLADWAFSSKLLFYAVVVVSATTLPLLVCSLCSLWVHRKSQYFLYLASIIIANFVLLGTVLTNVVMEHTHFFSGVVICKLSAFLVNASSCFVHWTWVAMYLQRFVHVFFPIRSRRRIPRSTWIVILLITGSSVLSQLWTPVLITELSIGSDDVGGTYCAEDPLLAGSTSLKTLVIVECVLTFFLPLALTVLTDISVLLVLRNPCTPQFTLVASDQLCNDHDKCDATALKIVSKSKLKCAEKRRSTAIRRCLLTATLSLLLNLPNYSLQLIDEFYQLRDSTDYTTKRMFLRIDAAVYILYLLQFPIVPIYMHILKEDLTKSSKQQSSTDRFRKFSRNLPLPHRIEQSRSTFSVA